MYYECEGYEKRYKYGLLNDSMIDVMSEHNDKNDHS